MTSAIFFTFLLWQVTSDFETQGCLVKNSSEACFHFCEFPVRPVAVFPFNNETAANDVSPYKGKGQEVGTSYAPGIHGEPGGSIEVHGHASSYIELDRGNLDTRRSITILLNVYPTQDPSPNAPIVNYKRNGHGVQILVVKDSAIWARINKRNEKFTSPLQSEKGLLRKNEWHYIGVSYNWSTGFASLWHNGNNVTSKVIEQMEIATRFEVRIGAREDDTAYFSGRVACLQFYDKALTKRQIEKARIACRPFEPVGNISVTVRHENKYIEIYENISIVVENDKGVKFSEYTFNVGDGSPTIETDQDMVNHSYSKHGVFSIEAFIYSRCRNETLRVGTHVTVEKPVELLGNLTLSADPVPFPAFLLAVLVSNRGTDFECLWNFIDGYANKTRYQDFGMKHTLRRAFITTGNYSLRVLCENRLSRAEVSTTVIVQTPIKGLSIDAITPKRHLKEFMVSWRVQNGTGIRYSASFAGKELQVSKSPDEFRGWAWVQRSHHVGIGVYDVTVTATNRVSGMLLATSKVGIENDVEPFQPRLFWSGRDIEVNDTVVIFMSNINKENGAKPIYKIDLGDGGNVLETRNEMINISYSLYGEFLVKVNASNNVSFFNTSISIKVHKPVLLIEGLKLSVEPTIFLNATKINVTVEQGSDVVCNATFGRDSPTSLFDLRAQSIWDPVNNPEITTRPEVRFIIEHTYTNVGAYIAIVTCLNRLSRQTATVEVIVQMPITGARLFQNHPVEFGRPFNVTLEMSSGTNATIEVKFQAHKFRQQVGGTSAFQMVSQGIYQSAGLHQFDVTLWNLVTLPIQIKGYVLIEVPIYGLKIHVIKGSRDIEVNETVRFAVEVHHGSNPEYAFNFGDSSFAVTTRNSTVQHLFHSHGTCIVKVAARNNVSQQIRSLNVFVVKPVVLLKGLHVMTKATVVNDTADIYLHLSEGSDLACHWRFGDGQNTTSNHTHLQYYSDGFTTDKRPFQNLTFNGQHRYNTEGLFRITATCQNRLSAVTATAIIVIQRLIEGLHIRRIPVQVVSQKFEVSWSISRGTNVTFNASFPGANITSRMSLYVAGSLRAILTNPGEYVFSVDAYNLVSPTQTALAIIVAEIPVSNLRVNVTYESQELEINEIVTFSSRLGTGTSPMFHFDFGDSNIGTNVLGIAHHKYSFNVVYKKMPKTTYIVRVKAFNNVSSVNATVNVTVYKPVLPLHNVQLMTLPSNVSEDATITLAIGQGSDFHCSCDFGDKNISKAIAISPPIFLGEDRTPIETFRKLSYPIRKIYGRSSIYRLHIECRNRLNKISNETAIVVQGPIAGLNVSKIPPISFNESFEIAWGITNGTDVEFEVVFGNVTFEVVGKGRNIFVTPEIYKVDGTFQAIVTAKNLVSRAHAQTTIIIENPVFMVSLIATLEHQGEFRGGSGSFRNNFPTDNDIMFKVSAKGSNLLYQWLTDDVTVKIDTEPFLRHRFNTTGTHNVSVIVMNKVSRVHENISVIIHYPIRDPVLQSNSPQKLKNPIKFDLFATHFGTDSCFFVDFGDGSNATMGHEGCQARHAVPNLVVVSPFESVQFDHIYRDVGEYRVTLNASNVVSFMTRHADVELVYAYCASPEVIIENLGLHSNMAPRVNRSSPFTVHTEVKLDCERTSKIYFKWRVLLLALSNSDRSYHDNIAHTERELYIPRRHLDYGVYEVHFTAQMALSDTDKYRSTAIGYLQVVPSPLIAKIDGGNLISRGFGKEVIVDASKSKDPDVEIEDDPGLGFTWLCRTIYTQFPPGYYPEIDLRTPYDRTGRTGGPDTPHFLGCYGNGSFIFPGHDSLLKLNTAQMMENETYVVFVIVEKGERTAWQYQVIEVVPGDPPVSRIDCKQNCEYKICTSKRLSLFASCFDGCFRPIIYKWEVYQNIGNSTLKTWVPKEDILQSRLVKDPKGPVFTVPKDVFEGDSEYLIRLYGSRSGGVEGKSESVFFTNDVPKGGTCFGSPQIGEALVTNFHIWCNDWEDDDTPLSYEFYYRNEEGKFDLFSYGLHNYTNSELPLGDATHNYTLEIYIKIVDSLNGEANYSLFLQSVEPQMQGNDLDNKLSNMTSGENSELTRLVNIGDSQAALRLVAAVNSLLNAQSLKVSSNHSEQEHEVKEKRKAVRTSVIKAATALPVTSLNGLQQSAGMIASATMFKQETSTTAMNASNEAFGRMVQLLQKGSSDSAGFDAVVSGAEALLAGMGQVLNAAGSTAIVKLKRVNATSAPPTCAPFDFTCSEAEDPPENATKDSEDEGSTELEGESALGRDAAINIVGMLGSIGKTILENKLEGDQPSVLSTAKLNMAVELSDTGSLGNSSIGDGEASFKMPNTGKLFGNSLNGSVVEKQMTAMTENPFTWGKKSSHISGKVISLSFSAQGQALDVSNLNETDPIDIFLPRDAPLETPLQFVYNQTVHRGWRIHKFIVEKNGSAVNVDVRLIGSDRGFEVYARRGESPTSSEYDWRRAVGNFTAEELTTTQKHRRASEDNSNSYEENANVTRSIYNRESSLVNTTHFVPHFKQTARVEKEDSTLSLFLPQADMYIGTYFIGIKFADERSDMSSSSYEEFSVNYTLRTYKSQCLYWNEEFQNWKSDGCQVGNLTTVFQTHCRCTHLTAFGSMMDVAPNPIDFSAVAAGFSSMFETGNVAVFFMVVSLFLIYPLLLLWARRADNKDMEQVGATPIPTLVSNASYHYELTFFTGQRLGASTTAQISCTLTGDRSNSGICVLRDEKRPTFQKGSANSFIISCERCLGQIQSLRVWHDNFGLSSSWFLKRALLRDVQTGEVWVFICERWFALDEDDGEIVRELTPASEKELTAFSRLFGSKLYKDFTDAHLWFSVALKPSRSSFTRAQRLSCCLCLLCTAMVASAMFYGQGGDSESDDLVLGPVTLNLRSVMIGLQSSLVVIPVNLVVVTLFKSVKAKGNEKNEKDKDAQTLNEEISDDENWERDDLKEDGGSRPKEQRTEKDVVALEDVVCDPVDEHIEKEKSNTESAKQNVAFFGKRPGAHYKYFVDSTNSIDEPQSKETKEDKKKKKKKGFLPYWCLYVAWSLCIMACVTSALFTLFYSMMWGKSKSEQWLVSMLLTFSQDTLITQPAKVLFLSALYAIVIRKSDEGEEAEQSDGNAAKGYDEEWLHLTDNNDSVVSSESLKERLQLHKPPEEAKLSALRANKVREKELRNKFVKVGDYTLVLVVLLLVSYSIRDPGSYSFRNSLEQELIHPRIVPYPQSLSKVSNVPLLWKWLEYSLIPGLYEDGWYNGNEVTDRTGFTRGRQSMRLGRTRLRQVRVTNGSCVVPKPAKGLIFECNSPYEVSLEETRMYSPGWKDDFKIDSSLHKKRTATGQLSPWRYLSSSESNCSGSFYGRISTYSSGGYLAEFGKNLHYSQAFVNYLKKAGWVDKYTRAILIEGAIYNPGTNLVGVIETMIELTSAAGTYPKVNFKIFRLFSTLDPSFAFNTVVEILFFVILLYTLYTIVKGVYVKKKEYFHEVISWLNIIFFVDGIAIVAVYFFRARLLKEAVQTIQNDQESFINFSECGMYTETIVYLYALEDFIAIVKFLHFLSFTRIVQVLSTTIFRSLSELQSYALMFFMIIMAYASMVYTCYAPYAEDYRSVSATMGSLVSLTMGVFDFSDLTSQPDFKIVGYFFLASFSCSMMFIFTNVLLTIINVVYKDVQEDEDLKKHELSFFNLILDRLFIIVGLRQLPERNQPAQIGEPTIEELQWNLNVQYLTENQLTRLHRLINSIYLNDETKEILVFALLHNLEKETQLQLRMKDDYRQVKESTERPGMTGVSDAADHDMEYEPILEFNKTPCATEKCSEEEDQQKAKETRSSDDERHKDAVETLSQMIAKKSEELNKMESEGLFEKEERIHRIRVINCLQDLLDKTVTEKNLGNILLSYEDESEV